MREDQRFGALLKRYRRAAHLTQEALAGRAGYSSHYVSMLERGVRPPRPLTIDTLADALTLSAPDRQALHHASNLRRLEDARPGIPPLPAAPLLGREGEIAQIVRLLRDEDARLVTLTGPGGVGKTSLAMTVAATLAPTFADGVAVVDFSAVSDPGAILATIARALAVRDMRGQPIRSRLIALLRERESLLLLLDCFERVVEGAESVGELLAACPNVKCVITSRAPLRLRIERELRIQPLALPEQGEARSLDALITYPSVALFLRHARAANPNIALDGSHASDIVDICRRLDGLPLAIELAAARVVYLPLPTLRDRLQQSLRILTGGARDLPARQQRMRDTISWSYDLLADARQALLRRLSVFAGSWRLDAAEEICSADTPAESVLDGLRALAESSLIFPIDRATDEPRYRMLDTIQEFAAEQLTASDEVETIRRRHALYYMRLAEQAEGALQDRSQAVWYPRLEREHDNIRAALVWLLGQGQSGAELALRLAGALWRFWHRHGDIREGRQWLEISLARAADAPPRIRAKALWGASWLAYHLGDYQRGSALSAEHLALARAMDDPLSVRNALTGVGIAALAEGRYADGLRALEEALDACAPLGNIWHRATSSLNLGAAALVTGDLARAARHFDDAASLYQERGDAVFTARAVQHLGYVALLRGDYAGAGACFTETLQALFTLGELAGVADGLEAVAAAQAATGYARQAGMLIGAASALRQRIGVAALPHIRAVWQPYVSGAEQTLGPEGWAAACADGALLSVEAAVAHAASVYR